MPRAVFTPSTTPIEQKLFLNSKEVAQLLSIKPLTACHLIRSGAIKASYIGRGYLVRRADLDAFLERQAQVSSKRRAA
jgi:excisionase family DNA binding protein